jgi:hypothetical protein
VAHTISALGAAIMTMNRDMRIRPLLHVILTREMHTKFKNEQIIPIDDSFDE